MTAPDILVVDDEPPILELVRGYLEREGFSVRTVEDGLAAVEQVRADQPDVVVLDLMPRYRRDRGLPTDPDLLRCLRAC